MDLIKELNADILKYKDKLYEKNVVIGVSCGVDSMVLLNLLEKVSENYKFNIVVAHVNHKRRAESEEEEAYIRAYCEKKHKLYVKEMVYNTDHVASFQEYARKERLNFFFDVMEKENASVLFLAHHLNDDIETSIMHFIRGGSLNSISGLKMETIIKDKIILRPLINVLKDDLYEYAKGSNIKFFEDKTNFEDDYTRNRIRHNIVTELFRENPSFKDSFLSYKEKLAYASKLIDDIRDKYIAEFVKKEDNLLTFTIDSFNSLDSVIQDEVLFEILKKYNFSKANINELKKLINSSKKNLVTNYKDICFIKEGNIVKISSNLYQKEEYFIKIDKVGKYKISDDLELVFEKVDNISTYYDFCISNVDIIWYNTNMFPFVLRTRKDGDSIMLSTGHKKIKDLLIDEHINPIDKDKTLLLLDKDESIICVLGIKKSQVLANSKDNNLLIKINRRTK